MVGQRTLNPLIQVRILASQPLKRRRERLVRMIVPLAIVAVGAATVPFLRDRPSPSPSAVWTETPTTSVPGVISNAAEAITRTLNVFPPGHDPSNAIARLLSRRSLEYWLAVDSHWRLQRRPTSSGTTSIQNQVSGS
jgi:hypothetical protein